STCQPHVYSLPHRVSLPTFFFCRYRAHRDLHSFPTRRSSDLHPSVLNAPQNYILSRIVWYSELTLLFLTLVETISLNYLGEILRSEEHTSELQSRENLVCRLLLEKKNEPKAGARTLGR